MVAAMKRFHLRAILLVALGVRLALLVAAWNSPEGLFTPDSHDYVRLSDNLADSASFELAGRPELFRTPGYPFFLLIGLPFGRHWWHVVVAVQILLDVLTVYLTFLLGVMLCGQAGQWGRRVGLWAAAFQAVSPLAVAAVCRILSDGIFAFMLTLAILLLVHHFKTSRWWSLICSAVVSAAACYVRAVGMLFVGMVLLMLVARAFRSWFVLRRQGRRRSLQAVAAGLVAIAVLSPWAIRNVARCGYAGFSSSFDYNIFAYEAPAVLGEARGISIDQARAALDAEYRCRPGVAASEDPPPGRTADAMGQVGWRTVFDYPLTTVKVHLLTSTAVFLPGVTDVLEAVGATTGGKGTLAVLRAEGLPAAVRHYFGGRSWTFWLCMPAVGLLAVKYVLIIICAFGRVRLRMGAAGWLILLTILLFAFAGGPASTPRFRAVIEPLLSVAAASGLVLLWPGKKRAGGAAGGVTS